MTNEPAKSGTPSSPRKKLRRVMVLLVLVALSLWVARFVIESVAHNRIIGQLQSAGFPTADVGSVSLGTQGIQISDVSASGKGTGLRIKQIFARQPITKLVMGDTNFQAIEITTAEVRIDKDKLPSTPTMPLSLAGFKLPFEKLIANDASVILSDSDSELRLDHISVSAEKNPDSATEFQIRCNQVASGSLQVIGTLSSDGSLTFDANANSLQPVDGQWQNWPYVPASIGKHLGADGTFNVKGNFKLDSDFNTDYSFAITSNQAKLRIHKYNLPINIRSADVLVENGVVKYRKILAGFENADRVIASGSTTIRGLPCISKFEGTFEDVDVIYLRRLVPGIPDPVFGNATGKANGSVVIDDQSGTTLRLSANGDTVNGGYGKINAKTGNIDVQIQPLELDSRGKKKTLQGAVTVNAVAENEPADNILKTFNLMEIDRQFEIDVAGSGDTLVIVPLDTAGDMRTWTLNVDATCDAGSVSALPLAQTDIKAFLRDGYLCFDPIDIHFETWDNSKRDPHAELKIQWPIASQLRTKDATGLIEAIGYGIAPRPAALCLAKQLTNANVGFRFQDQIEKIANSSLAGKLNFQSTIRIPAYGERPTDSWQVNGKLTDTTLLEKKADFHDLVGQFSIKQGIFRLDDIVGTLNTFGKTEGHLAFDLESRKLIDGTFSARDIPAPWLSNLAFGPTDAATLDGKIDIELARHPEIQDEFNVLATSNDLVINGTEFTKVAVRGVTGPKSWLEQISAQGDNGLTIDLQGRWPVPGAEGNMTANWNQVPLSLASSALPSSLGTIAPGSSTSGRLNIVSRDGSLQAKGDSTIDGLKIGQYKLKPVKLAFASTETATEITSETLKSLKAKFSSDKRFQFSASLDEKAINVSDIVDDSRLSGSKLSVNLQASGGSNPFSMRTTGKAALNGYFSGRKVPPATVKWDFDNQNPESLVVDMKVLGGQASVRRGAGAIDALAVEFESIEGKQLATFLGTDIRIDGELSGTTNISALATANPKVNFLASSPRINVGNDLISDLGAAISLEPVGDQTKLGYELTGRLFDGNLTCSGKVDDFDSAVTNGNGFPLNIQLTNAQARRAANALLPQSKPLFRAISGKISLNAKSKISLSGFPEVSGRVRLDEAKWNGKRVSRRLSSDLLIRNQQLTLNNFTAELQQGEISGRANFPLLASAPGNFELNIRRFSLKRMLEILIDDPVEAEGLLSARFSGRTGSEIAGRGVLEISRAGLFGVADQKMKVPLRFAIQPKQQTGRIQMPRNRFRLFRGNVNGSAELTVGNSLKFKSNLQFSNLDSDSMIRSLTGFNVAGTGKLNGTLQLKSRNLAVPNDLTGSFKGNLENSSAFEIPLLNQTARLINTPSLQSRRFNSDQIELGLQKGNVEVRNFQLRNSLATVAIDGSATLDGKLNLGLAARVERLDQPTLLDEIAGSPLARFQGSGAAFFAQAAEFLSERILFLRIEGAANNPRIRLDPEKQLREELIRQFLRGSQILPNANIRN